MSTLAKNVSQVVLYENQVSDFVALLWMQTPLGHWIMSHSDTIFQENSHICMAAKKEMEKCNFSETS